MIHPAFEWIDESMDFSDVLTALGFASEFVTPQTELAAVLLTWKPGQLVAWTESQALLEEATEVLGPAYDPAGAELLPFGDQYWLPGME